MTAACRNGHDRTPESVAAGRCVECRRATQSRYKQRKRQSGLYQVLRAQAIVALGGRCACCGEVEHAFLTFDHMEGGGSAERQRSGNREAFYRSIINGARTDIQLLCANCNQAKELPGGCPHTWVDGYPRGMSPN